MITNEYVDALEKLSKSLIVEHEQIRTFVNKTDNEDLDTVLQHFEYVRYNLEKTIKDTIENSTYEIINNMQNVQNDLDRCSTQLQVDLNESPLKETLNKTEFESERHEQVSVAVENLTTKLKEDVSKHLEWIGTELRESISVKSDELLKKHDDIQKSMHGIQEHMKDQLLLLKEVVRALAD